MNDFFAAHKRNPHFTGRKNLLEDIRAKLGAGKPVVLVGPDGFGKSQIADEWGRLRVTDYDFRLWVRADDPANLIIEYAELAPSLGLPYNEESDLNEAASSVRNWLEQNGRWLLVFDDAQSPEDLKDYLPKGGSGHVVITSSASVSGWNEVASVVGVDPLDRSEAAELLRRFVERTDVPSSEALAEVLGGNPLALALAGAYIRWTGVSFSGYLDAYEEHFSSSQERNAPEVPSAVATAWGISFEQVQAVSQEGVDLLYLFAFLSPCDVPLDLLTKTSEIMSDALEQGFEALFRRGLIEVNEGLPSVHPLVQDLALYRLDEETQKTWIEATVQALSEAFSSQVENLDTWPECVRLFSHALRATEHAQRLEMGSEAASSLLNQMGLYLHRRGYFVGAKMVLERLLAIDEKIYGADHPEVAVDLNNLAGVLRLLGDLEGAKKGFERAIVIEERSSEPDQLKIAVRANNLGTVLRVLGDLEGAKENFERALSIDERSYGPNHFKTAIRLNNLGDVFQEMGRIEKARGTYQRALMIFQQFLGPGHRYTKLAREKLSALPENEKKSNCVRPTPP